MGEERKTMMDVRIREMVKADRRETVRETVRNILEERCGGWNDACRALLVSIMEVYDYVVKKEESAMDDVSTL